jgi:hypothetical protein
MNDTPSPPSGRVGSPPPIPGQSLLCDVEDEAEDSLNAARGLAFGIVLAQPIWAVITAAVYWRVA